MITASAYMTAAKRLLDESSGHGGTVRRALQRLSADYMRRACEGLASNDNGLDRTAAFKRHPVHALPEEGGGCA